MSFIKQIDFLQEIKKRHPTGFDEGRKKTIYELGSKDFRVPQMIELLKKYLQPVEEDSLYIINLEGIDILTPSAAKILVDSSTDISLKNKIPIIFTNVKPEVKNSLEFGISKCDSLNIIWIVNESGKAELLGKIPNKLKELIELLEDKGEANASEIAEIIQGTATKKDIGNISVYLQKLFNFGLVGRNKVTALDRKDAERGWTYSYFTAPTILRQCQPKNYMRIS